MTMTMTQQQQYDEATREELLERIEELEAQLAGRRSRRRFLATAAGVAGAGAVGAWAGLAEAQPSGTFPASTDDPLLKIRADRVRLVGRTSDPSSPDDGTMWYRSDL